MVLGLSNREGVTQTHLEAFHPFTHLYDDERRFKFERPHREIHTKRNQLTAATLGLSGKKDRTDQMQA